MQLTRQNKVTLEFTGVDEIKMITSIFQKCTTKKAPLGFLIRGSKTHFTQEEKDMIIKVSDKLDQIKV